MEFKEFPKVPRLSREMVITEKLDGTNASVWIVPGIDMAGKPWLPDTDPFLYYDLRTDMFVAAGSRTRFVKPGKQDNYGFAGWVKEHAEELLKLGPGTHYGEWWGKGIQRGYELTEKRFSLFNTHRWGDPAARPACCDVVPVLYSGSFNTLVVGIQLRSLELGGSVAAPGFMDPEGIMVYHTAGNNLFKKTIKDDDVPKSAQKANAVSGGN